MPKKPVQSINSKEPWLEVQIKSWDQFDRSIDELGNREYLFRGQADKSWELTTSLDRSFESNQSIIYRAKRKKRSFAKKTHEEILIRSFQKNANLFLNFLPPRDEKLEWLAIMQHYGAPTRLLDVTLSPHIATFFALEEGLGDSCVFAIKHSELKMNNQFFIDKASYKDTQDAIFEGKDRFVSVFNPEYGNERQVVQQGLFLVPSQIKPPFDNLLSDYKDFADDEVCVKYIIPAKLRLSGLERLRRMNITSATLFPGIVGFSKSLKFQILETVQSQKLLE
jgi:hypothetical protein